jgi:phospholipase C
LAWFEQYQKADSNSPLAKKGMSFVGLDAFYAAAANGTLPEVSFIVGPTELSEHPPYQPKDGGWLQKQVVDAVTKSPKYSSTLLMISFDGELMIACVPTFPMEYANKEIQRPAVSVTTSLLSTHPKVPPENG